jgi:outer membrane protein assembly factor BamB
MSRLGLLSALILLAAQVSLAAELNTNDWPQWRGPNRDGMSLQKGLVDKWPEDGPPVLWQTKGLGKGYASVAVAAGKIFTLGNRDKEERLTCLEDKDGKELWSVVIGEGDHSNCTPTVDGDRVYGVGLKGDLVCVSVNDGKVIWKKNFEKDFGGKMMSGWGFSESPLVDGDRLIVTPGAQDAVVAALNKLTGEVIWKSPAPEDWGKKGKDGAAYSSVVVSNGAGVKQYVQLVGRGLISVAADDGRRLWTYNKIANGTANIPTPLVRGDYIFTSTGYGTGSALLKLVKSGTSVEAVEQYFLTAKEMENHHGGMILLGDQVYCGHGHNNGFPICFDLMTGKNKWRPGRGPGTGSAAVSFADGHLYFRYQNGVMALIEATPEEYRLKGEFKIAASSGPSWPHPVIANGKLYLREQDALVVYDIAKK